MRGLALLFVGVSVWAQTAAPAGEESAIESFESLIKSGQFENASRALEPYVTAHPEAWRALYQLGYVRFRQHNIRASLSYVSKSLALHPEFGEAHKILAFDLNILGRKDLAIRELEEAIRLTPNPWESHYELGRLLFERGFYPQAIEHFEKARELNPGFVKTYHNLGLAYGAINNDTKAVENFEQALARNRTEPHPSAWPLIDYATYLNQRNQFAKARDLLLDAERIDSSWAQEYEELSRAYRGLGETGEAIAALEKAVQLDPQRAEDHYALARLYTQTQRKEDAKRELSSYERIRATRNARAQ